ncbi:tpr domain protein [Aphelenchoides avenae]|nr:tpr domain protein [Aphelenchus avenae]
MLHTDRFLACRTIVDGIVAIGTSCLVEDLNGDIERITIYNVRDPNQLEWLHANTTLILKEPYLHYSSHTGVPSLRVDFPSDIIFVDETDKALLEFAGAIKWYKPEWFSFDQLKAKGNECFVEKDYEQALRFYTRALRLGADAAVIHLNSAAALLPLERYKEALDSAKNAMDSGANKEKALFRLGKAAYGMREWQTSRQYFEELRSEYPNNTSVADELKKVTARIAESKTGSFDFADLYERAVLNGERYFDIAVYVGPVEVAGVPEKGKGLVASEDISKGTLLLVSKAFAMSCADEYVPMVFTVNVINGVPQFKTQTLNIVKTIQTLQRNPQRVQELYALYAGTMSRDEAIPEGVIDAARIEQICIFNAYGSQNMFDRLNLEVAEESMIEKTPCGLWTLVSFINHSCLANAYRVYYGDVMAVHAIVDVKKGEEISLSYIDPTQAYANRAQQLKGFGIECSCRLCKTERADANRFEREKLVKQLTVLAGPSQSPAGKLAQMKLIVKKVSACKNHDGPLSTLDAMPLGTE